MSAKRKKQEEEAQPIPAHFVAHIYLQQDQMEEILLKELNQRGYISQELQVAYDEDSDTFYAKAEAVLPCNLKRPEAENTPAVTAVEAPPSQEPPAKPETKSKK